MPDIVSEVCVPLIDQERVVGILNVESINGVVLEEADLQLMSALSDHIGGAIAVPGFIATSATTSPSANGWRKCCAARTRNWARCTKPRSA